MQTANKLPLRLAGIAFLLTSVAFADYRSRVGYDQLLEEFGAALPDGSNLTLLQVEAPDPSGCWAAAATGETAEVAISFPYATAIPSKSSAHASIVAANLLGRSTSLLPAAPALRCMGASLYRGGSLHLGRFSAPDSAGWDIENHSYAGNAAAFNTNALQLLDHRIDRDRVTVVVALENGTGPVPALWGNTYNTITVGVSSGTHSRGGSTLEGAGRLKPDLVAPATHTSYATPMVASAAGLLLSEAKRTSELAAAQDPRVIKALLLAGACTDRFPTWATTSTSPLDPVFGAGELNIANSYHILRAGRQTTTGNGRHRASGWDCDRTSARSTYFFTVPEGQTLDLSVALTWHRELATTDYRTFTADLPDLALRLRRATPAFEAGAALAVSDSPLDNVELLRRAALPAGCYAREVSGPAGVVFGLAWLGVGQPATGPAARIHSSTSAAVTAPFAAAATTTVSAPVRPPPFRFLVTDGPEILPVDSAGDEGAGSRHPHSAPHDGGAPRIAPCDSPASKFRFFTRARQHRTSTPASG